MSSLLVISPRFLFPMDEGGKIRTANILKRMKGGAFQITLASPAPENFTRFHADIVSVCDHFLNWPERGTTRLRRIAALLDSAPVAAATDRSSAGRAIIEKALIAKPDVVLVDFPHAAVLLPREPLSQASVIFTHNVELEIFERHKAVARGPMRLIWRDQSRKMRRFEGEALRRFDRVIAVSHRDGKALTALYDLPQVDIIDTGVDLDFFDFAAPGRAAPFGPSGGDIVFTGAMDWRANIDGIEFLMDEVWPLVTFARPLATAVIVGRNPPADLVARAHERGLAWTFTGFVDDIRPYVAAGHVYVIPVRVGSGTRIKAFEAMSMGRPVVSTSVGVEGLDVTPEEHYLAADTAEAFAASILRLLADAELRDRLARAARDRVEERFSWSHVARQFEAICLRSLQRQRS